MIRVKDENGKIVEGVYKDPLGNFIVKRDSEYKKHKQQQEVINRLNDRVDSLSATVERLFKIVETLSTKDKEQTWQT